MWDVNIVDGLSAIFAAIALLVAISADRRSRERESGDDVAARSKAYYAMDQVLDVMRLLRVKTTEDLEPKAIASDQECLNRIARLCREAVTTVVVVPGFARLASTLNSLAFRAERLASLKTIELEDILDRIWFVRQWRDLYGDLMDIAINAAGRGEVTGRHMEFEKRFDHDPYIRPTYERSMNFGLYGMAHGMKAIEIEVRTGRRSQYEDGL